MVHWGWVLAAFCAGLLIGDLMHWNNWRNHWLTTRRLKRLEKLAIFMASRKENP